MKHKQLTTILAIIFLIGIVAATGTITNISNLFISNFTAGSTTTAEFSFDYPDINETYPNQKDYSPLVIKVNITSNDSGYPVWKNDFLLDGSMVNHGWWIFPDTYYFFNCYENDFTYYYNQNPYEVINIPNGTFYCYNPGFSKMRIGSSNDVELNINSNPALWPGQYGFEIGLYYPSDIEPQSQNQYIRTYITPIKNSVSYGENDTVEFNISFEIKGGNAIKMKMSNLTNEYGDSYSAEELNATLTYNNSVYNIEDDYWEGGWIKFPWTNMSQEFSETVVFKMDIKDYMNSGNYHGTYRFDVTEIK